MFGQALNNATILFASTENPLYTDGKVDLSAYWEIVSALYNEGKQIRKELLGY